MSVRLHGTISRLIGAALIGPMLLIAMPNAQAQVTLNLTTTQQTNCTVTTDAQGIRLVPGGTDLIATGVTLSGTGCGTQSASPPTPNPFTITPSPSGGQVGTTFQLAWAVANATSCTGTATLGGVTASVPGWTDVTSNTTISPRTVVLNTAGTYQFGLTCSNGAGSASGSASVVVTTTGGGGGNCPAGRQTTATVCYAYSATSGPTDCASRDVTQYAPIFGHRSSTDPVIDFPGYGNLYPTIRDASKAANNYFAVQFTMPTTLDPEEFGGVGKGETYGSHPLTLSISPNCGDFDNVPNPTLCKKIETAPVDTNGVKWKNQSNADIAACPLVPGQTYYLNFKFTTPPTDTTNCSGSTCYLPLSNNIGTTAGP